IPDTKSSGLLNKEEDMTENVESNWAARLKQGLSPDLEWLKSPPGDASLSEILDGRDLLQVADQEEHPNPEAARRLADRLASATRKAHIEDAATAALADIDRAIIVRLAGGQRDSRLIATRDFGDVRPMSVPGGGFGGPSERIIFLGLVESLPAEHPLRSILS